MASRDGRHSMRHRPATHRWILIAAIVAAAPALTRGQRAFAADILNFPPASFTIVSPDTNSAIGQLRYTSEITPTGAIVHGESRFNDGQSDIETSRLQSSPGGQLPVLVEFDHSFFDKSGTLIRRGHANLQTGTASCFVASGGVTNPNQALDFPPDTWAGASVLIPIQYFLRSGETDNQHLHVFTCAPDPRVLPIDVQIEATPVSWPLYGHDAVRVDVKPDFGWLNVIVAPFVPKLHAWFAPGEQWNFVGGDMARYYRGPNITLVKSADNSKVAPAQTKR